MPITAICFDTETTGVNPNVDEILELSICDQNGNKLLHSYFKPEKHTEWPGAERVNGISPELVVDKPHIREYLPRIQAIFDNPDLTALIGYNTIFDIRMLQGAGVRIPEYLKVIDVMREFAPIYGEKNEKYSGYKWQKLTTCAAYYGYTWPAGAAHDSYADTLATLYCYGKIYGENF